jgi:hypothetical protein
MSEIVFTVRSENDGEQYRLEASRTDRGIRFTCSCAAGLKGSHCQHRLALLLKDTRACVEVVEADVVALHAMAKGSHLMHAIEMMVQAQATVDEAQADLRRAKKVLATMLGG